MARDWPQWRGPFLDGSTDETGLPETWSLQENIQWATIMPGEGGSTPVIQGDRVFVSSSDRGGEDLYALCLDRRTGEILWNRPVGSASRRVNYNKDASPSPVVHGDRVVFLFGSGDFLGFDLDGNVAWSHNLEDDFGPLTQLFIYGASPLLYRGRLYVSVLRCASSAHMPEGMRSPEPLESFLLCVDPGTGEYIWKRERPTDTSGPENRDSYATPIPWESGDTAEIIIIGGDYVTGHDWETGREKWRMNYRPDTDGRQRIVPTPVLAGGHILAVKPRAGTLFALPTGLSGDVPYDRIAWHYDGATPDVPSILSYGDRIYFLQDSKRVITCMDPKTGEKIWEEKIGGKGIYHASPMGADGKIFCVNLAGEVIVLAAGDGFREISRIPMGGEPAMSTIVAAHGNLFVRTAEKLYCIGEGKRDGAGTEKEAVEGD